MNQIVRRVNSTPVVQHNGDLLPAKLHRAGGIFVQSQLALGIQPKLLLTWAVQPSYWSKGFSLMVFRSMSGFSAQKYPEDLNLHGQLIIETMHDASFEEHPPEGWHYYTFLLYKRGLLGLSEKMSLVRFSENVPSAKVGIGRIRDQLELKAMGRRDEVGDIEHEARLNEAEVRKIRSRRQLEESQTQRGRGTRTARIVSEELEDIDAMVEVLLAKKQKIEELKRNPAFQALSPDEQQEIIDRIQERLDAGEVSARREMWGS